MFANDWAISVIARPLHRLSYTTAPASLWLHTSSSDQFPPLSLCLSHPSPLPRWSHPSLFTASHSQEAHPWHSLLAPSLALCSLIITMKDKGLMISIQHSLLAPEYTSWINPKIYDINTLSSSKCGWPRTGQWGWTEPCRNHDYLHLSSGTPTSPHHRWKSLKDYNCEISSTQFKTPFRAYSTSLNFSLYHTYVSHPPPS